MVRVPSVWDLCTPMFFFPKNILPPKKKPPETEEKEIQASPVLKVLLVFTYKMSVNET